MSLLDLLFPVATVVLGVGCFACYRSNKPLREKAAKEAQEAAEKKAREEAAGRERTRADNFRKEVLEDLEFLLRDPHRATGEYTTRNSGTRYPLLHNLVEQFRHWEQMGRTNRSQEKQIADLNKIVRELRAEIKEVHRKLEPYA